MRRPNHPSLTLINLLRDHRLLKFDNSRNLDNVLCINLKFPLPVHRRKRPPLIPPLSNHLLIDLGSIPTPRLAATIAAVSQRCCLEHLLLPSLRFKLGLLLRLRLEPPLLGRPRLSRQGRNHRLEPQLLLHFLLSQTLGLKPLLFLELLSLFFHLVCRSKLRFHHRSKRTLRRRQLNRLRQHSHPTKLIKRGFVRHAGPREKRILRVILIITVSPRIVITGIRLIIVIRLIVGRLIVVSPLAVIGIIFIFVIFVRSHILISPSQVVRKNQVYF